MKHSKIDTFKTGDNLQDFDGEIEIKILLGMVPILSGCMALFFLSLNKGISISKILNLFF